MFVLSVGLFALFKPSVAKSASGLDAANTLGLPELQSPIESPQNPEIIALGRRLFFDKRLSADHSVSCASCHDPQKSFTDGRALAVGLHGKEGTRNAPSLINVAFQQSLFWDGRVISLESQAQAPLLNPSEHGLKSRSEIEDIISHDTDYPTQFGHAFGQSSKTLTDQLTIALAQYERTLIAGNSRFDRYYYGGENEALSANEIRGLALFQGRAQCDSCHLIETHSALLTDQKFHASTLPLPQNVDKDLSSLTNTVVYIKQSGDPAAIERMITGDRRIAALGRFVVTQQPADIGMFKTPSLRNVAVTGPYMHDGSVTSLAQVVNRELYVRGAATNYPIILTDAEQQDLVAFLGALTSQISD